MGFVSRYFEARDNGCGIGQSIAYGKDMGFGTPAPTEEEVMRRSLKRAQETGCNDGCLAHVRDADGRVATKAEATRILSNQTQHSVVDADGRVVKQPWWKREKVEVPDPRNVPVYNSKHRADAFYFSSLNHDDPPYQDGFDDMNDTLIGGMIEHHNGQPLEQGSTPAADYDHSTSSIFDLWKDSVSQIFDIFHTEERWD